MGLVQRVIVQEERMIALTTELKKTLLNQIVIEGLRDFTPAWFGRICAQLLEHTQMG